MFYDTEHHDFQESLVQMSRSERENVEFFFRFSRLVGIGECPVRMRQREKFVKFIETLF